MMKIIKIYLIFLLSSIDLKIIKRLRKTPLKKIIPLIKRKKNVRDIIKKCKVFSIHLNHSVNRIILIIQAVLYINKENQLNKIIIFLLILNNC